MTDARGEMVALTESRTRMVTQYISFRNFFFLFFGGSYTVPLHISLRFYSASFLFFSLLHFLFSFFLSPTPFHPLPPTTLSFCARFVLVFWK